MKAMLMVGVGWCAWPFLAVALVLQARSGAVSRRDWLFPALGSVLMTQGICLLVLVFVLANAQGAQLLVEGWILGSAVTWIAYLRSRRPLSL